jgi:hypothetical protein
MRRSRRARNRGMSRKMVSRIRLSVDASAFALTRRVNLDCLRAKGHTFGAKPNRRYRRDVTSMIIANSFLGRTSVLRGVICNFGPSSTKPASKCLEWETQTHSLITSKRSTNLPRSYSERFAGISNSSARSAMATAITLNGVQTSAGSTSPQHIVSHHTRS